MIFGVRTEEGIQRSSALYLKSDRAFPAAYKNTNVKEVWYYPENKKILTAFLS